MVRSLLPSATLETSARNVEEKPRHACLVEIIWSSYIHAEKCDSLREACELGSDEVMLNEATVLRLRDQIIQKVLKIIVAH